MRVEGWPKTACIGFVLVFQSIDGLDHGVTAGMSIESPEVKDRGRDMGCFSTILAITANWKRVK
jgi:hypothetical protein